METIRELLIAIGLDVHEAEFANAIAMEHALEKGAELLIEVLKEIPEQLVEVIHATAEYAHQLEDASDRTGMSTTSLQQFGYVAGLAGMGAEEMEVSVNHLARTMSAAKMGSQEAMLAFGKLGVRVTDASGHLRSADDVLGDVAQGLHKLPKGPERAAAAIEVFGRSGARMVNILGEGKEGLAKLREEFEDLGLEMNEEAIQEGAHLEKGLIRLRSVADALKREFAGPFIKALNPVVDGFLDWVKANRELIRTRLTDFATNVAHALSDIGHGLGWLVQNWEHLALALSPVFALVIDSGIEAAVAWAAAALPVIALVAGFVLLGLAIDDVLTYLRGGQSLIGELGPKWIKFIDEFTKPLPREPGWLTAIKALAAALSDIQGFWEAFRNDSPDNPTGQNWFRRHFGASESVPAGFVRMANGSPVFNGGAAGPEAAGASAAASSYQPINFDATFNITASPGMNTEDVAHQAVRQIKEILDQGYREAMATGH